MAKNNKDGRRYDVRLRRVNEIRGEQEILDPERGPENKISNRKSKKGR
ncbi:MAG: hypothetical protein PWQ96_2365 [Clostridia bacterium]|jgi:hypothetical protein|nr:hypothetical protein [Clostridiales bacterium]MDK2986721.1 hypothetical protein [Clostridia bacterium]